MKLSIVVAVITQFQWTIKESLYAFACNWNFSGSSRRLGLRVLRMRGQDDCGRAKKVSFKNGPY